MCRNYAGQLESRAAVYGEINKMMLENEKTRNDLTYMAPYNNKKTCLIRHKTTIISVFYRH